MGNRNVPRMINNVVLKDDDMSSEDFEDYCADLLGWVNDKLKTKFKKISDLDGGDAYCNLLERLFPGHVAMCMVNKGRNKDCCRRNFLVLQKAFHDLNIHTDVPVERLLEHSFQDGVLFLKWFRTFYETNVEPDSDDQSSDDQSSDDQSSDDQSSEEECDVKPKKTPKPRSKAPPKDSKAAPKDSKAAPKDSKAAPKDSKAAPKDSMAAPKDSMAAPKGTKTKKPSGVKNRTKEALVEVLTKKAQITPEAKKRLIKNVTSKKGNSKSTKPPKKNQNQDEDDN